MKSKGPSTLFASMGIFAGMLFCLATGSSAKADLVVIDPGLTGSQNSGIYLDITSDFTSAFGSTLVGQDVLLDLRFSGMKHVASPAGLGFRTQLFISYDDFSSSEEPTINDTFLFDQAGNSLAIPDSTSTSAFFGNTDITGEYSTPISEPLSGVHFDVTLQDIDKPITEVGLFFQTYNSNSPFTVGVSSVPEPSSFAMIALAVAGLGFRRRK